MPVIPNLADSRAESRVKAKRVEAFPALTGKRPNAGNPDLCKCGPCLQTRLPEPITHGSLERVQNKQSLWLSPIPLLNYFPLTFIKIFQNGHI